jgi:hypothetical protein
VLWNKNEIMYFMGCFTCKNKMKYSKGLALMRSGYHKRPVRLRLIFSWWQKKTWKLGSIPLTGKLVALHILPWLLSVCMCDLLFECSYKFGIKIYSCMMHEYHEDDPVIIVIFYSIVFVKSICTMTSNQYNSSFVLKKYMYFLYLQIFIVFDFYINLDHLFY